MRVFLQNVNIQYNNQVRVYYQLFMDNQTDFLERVDTHMKKSGEIIKILAVAGPNGAGKTTLIKGIVRKFP